MKLKIFCRQLYGRSTTAHNVSIPKFWAVIDRPYRSLVILAGLLFCVAVTVALPKAVDEVGVSVHEWGTFTSVAGENGDAVAWRTYGGSADLPCFVHRFGGFKGGLFGTVRMETPVLYFYGSRESAADVKVRFPNGTITEWYPQAALTRTNDAIEWRSIRISPGASPDFPVDGRDHYYAARDTDAAPLQVGTQKEKFLFYRGVGTFSLPVSAKSVEEGNILVKNRGAGTIAGVMVFQNRQGKIGYQVAGDVESEHVFDPNLFKTDSAALLQDLENILVRQGLYRKEAQAMIQTWRDSWFEEGTRLFYIVPKSVVDSALPLDIQPVPHQITRVFVARMEIITPAIQEDVKRANEKNDRVALEKYGRFLEPIARRLAVKSPLVDSVYSKFVAQAAACDR
jgi:hypothetical protein